MNVLLLIPALLYVAGVIAAIVTVWRCEARMFNGPSLAIIPAIIAFAVCWPVIVVMMLLIELAEQRGA